MRTSTIEVNVHRRRQLTEDRAVSDTSVCLPMHAMRLRLLHADRDGRPYGLHQPPFKKEVR